MTSSGASPLPSRFFHKWPQSTWARTLRIVLAIALSAATGVAAGHGDDAERWHLLGPEGGSASAVKVSAVLPGVSYAGLDVGGVYRSADRGESWVPWSDGVAAARVNAFAEAADGTLYAATNRGIHRLDPGAETWSAVGQGLGSFPYASEVHIDPTVPGRLFATVLNGFIAGSWTLFRSDDRGESWSEVDAAPSIASPLAVSAAQPTTVFVGGSSGISRSRDGGATWTSSSFGAIRFPSFRDILAHPTDPEVLYASARDVVSPTDSFANQPHRSDDGGRTWRPIAEGLGGVSTRSPAGAFAVDPNRPDRVFITTAAGLYVSDNRGATWRPANPPPADVRLEALDIGRDGSALAAGAPGGGMLLSTDAGASWRQVNDGFLAAQVTAISPDPVVPGRVLIVRDNELLISHDSGLTWSAVEGDRSVSRGADLLRDPVDPAVVRIAGGGGLVVSEDGGLSWRQVEPTAPIFPATVVHDPESGDLLAAVDGALRRSADAVGPGRGSASRFVKTSPWPHPAAACGSRAVPGGSSSRIAGRRRRPSRAYPCSTPRCSAASTKARRGRWSSIT
ncbi:MAG: hypothetical protein AAGM22_10320 [Acidobacteriota bacterium]